jgi:hypothetical protein
MFGNAINVQGSVRAFEERKMMAPRKMTTILDVE